MAYYSIYISIMRTSWFWRDFWDFYGIPIAKIAAIITALVIIIFAIWTIAIKIKGYEEHPESRKGFLKGGIWFLLPIAITIHCFNEIPGYVDYANVVFPATAAFCIWLFLSTGFEQSLKNNYYRTLFSASALIALIGYGCYVSVFKRWEFFYSTFNEETDYRGACEILVTISVWSIATIITWIRDYCILSDKQYLESQQKENNIKEHTEIIQLHIKSQEWKKALREIYDMVMECKDDRKLIEKTNFDRYLRRIYEQRELMSKEDKEYFIDISEGLLSPYIPEYESYYNYIRRTFELK